MKRIISTSAVLAAIVAIPSIAIAQTSIRDLISANSTTISGQIVRISGEDFVLDDGTGQLLVETEDRLLRRNNFRVGEEVAVTGTHDDDSFDAISITRANGEVIYVFDD